MNNCKVKFEAWKVIVDVKNGHSLLSLDNEGLNTS